MTNSDFRNRKDELDAKLEAHTYQDFSELEEIVDGYRNLIEEMLENSTKLSNKQLFFKNEEYRNVENKDEEEPWHPCYIK